MKEMPMEYSSAWSLRDLTCSLTECCVEGDCSGCVSRLDIDSRQVQLGSLFFAASGSQLDGNHYIENAIRAGAVGIVSEEPCCLKLDVPWIQVEDVRVALAQMAKCFYNKPDELLKVIAITGTNGKTTIAKTTQQLIQSTGFKCGYIGTLEYDLGNRTVTGQFTTPHAIDIYKYLREMVDNGCTHAVLEASSHGIEQKRIYGLDINVAVFSNLSQDHLDYHGSMDTYANAKKGLFDGVLGKMPQTRIINIDNAYGALLADTLPGLVQTLGKKKNANYQLQNIYSHASGSSFDVMIDNKLHGFEIPLIGDFNVYNTALVLAIGHQLGLNIKKMSIALMQIQGVKGRLEPVQMNLPFNILVDFAHTPEALENILKTLKKITQGRLIVVFGCGGDRDRSKRPKMTRVVQDWADYAWATADNPRTESVEDIFGGMKVGVYKPEAIAFLPDRRLAIRAAINFAKEGDCVVIAGKGHETYQIFADKTIEFDDYKVAQEEAAKVTKGVCV